MKYTDTLTTLFGHNLWANLRLLESCAALTEEQLNATSIGAFGSIRDILEHIVSAERSYFSRISTGQRYNAPEGAPPMTLAQMTESVRTTGAGFIEWLPKVQPQDTVTIDWDGTPRDVPKTYILTQVINHATEHREQIKTIMTGLGIEPPDLQGWEYFDAVDSGRA
ncbi:MAG: DinB family protein [Anaerolineae bacterium]|nr:DinB family protein [Anaerolineae bacterium]